MFLGQTFYFLSLEFFVEDIPSCFLEILDLGLLLVELDPSSFALDLVGSSSAAFAFLQAHYRKLLDL